jgi:hypothetical protein
VATNYGVGGSNPSLPGCRCGGIGRRARFRFSCLRVGVRVSPSVKWRVNPSGSLPTIFGNSVLVIRRCPIAKRRALASQRHCIMVRFTYPPKIQYVQQNIRRFKLPDSSKTEKRAVASRGTFYLPSHQVRVNNSLWEATAQV